MKSSASKKSKSEAATTEKKRAGKETDTVAKRTRSGSASPATPASLSPRSPPVKPKEEETMFAKPKKSPTEEEKKSSTWLSKSASQTKTHLHLAFYALSFFVFLGLLKQLFRPSARILQANESGAIYEKCLPEPLRPIMESAHLTPTENERTKPFDPYTMNIGPKAPETVPCFVEVSKESRNKYEWDHDLGVLTLDRVLHSAVYYPHDYGFIPQTLCGDGDPLDILVISTSPLIPGCVVMCRPICYMVMEDEKGMDEKVLAVNAKDAHYHDIRTMKDLHEHTLREIAEFFATYKKLEKDKWAKVGGWRGTEDTMVLIKEAHENYKKQFEIELQASE